MKFLEPYSLARCAGTLLALVVTLAACTGGDPQALVTQARGDLARGDFKQAIIQAKTALQRMPDLPEARYLLGVALLRTGDAAGAEAELRRALALGFAAATVAPALAQAMLAQGLQTRLIAEFADTVLDQTADLASLKTSLATAYALEGDAQASQAALSAALTADPHYAPALLMRARALAGQNDVEGALAVLDSIIARTPANHQAWQAKGDLLRPSKGKGDEALAAYRKVLEIKPDHVAAHVALLTLLLAQDKLVDAAAQLGKLKSLSPNQPQTRYFETLLAYQQDDFQRAGELSRQLLVLAPTDLRSLQLAGATALQVNDLVQAQAHLERVVRAAPQARLARQLLVSAYLRTGQGGKALDTLLPMLQGGEPDAATSALAGDVYRRTGDIKKAEAYLARAAKLAPKDARARTSLALTHLAAGRRDEGLGELQDVAASDSDITADLALIGTHLLNRDFDRAFKAIDGLEKKLPGMPQAASLRGRALMLQGDAVGARKSLERALAIAPAYFQAADGLATLDMAEKKPEYARKRFDAMLAKDPNNVHALLALARVRAASAAPSSEVADLIGRAVKVKPAATTPRLMLVTFHVQRNELAQAMAAAQEGVAANPSSAMLLDALGRVQQASGELRRAITTYTKAVAQQPQTVLLHMRLAGAQLADKDKAAAAASLRKALNIQPDLIEAQVELIALAVDSKDFKAALDLARTVQKQRPKQAVGYLLEADLATAQKKFDDALAVLRAGLKVVPAPDLARQMHSTLRASGKGDEADRFAAAWLKEQPTDALFRLYLGDLAIARNDLLAAERLYASVSQLDPTNAIAFNNLAWVSGKLKRSEAVAFAERAVALSPDYAGAMDTLAILLSDKGGYTKALAWENKALLLQPQNSLFRLNLAKIHLKGGQKDLAQVELAQLAKLGDKFQAQAEVARLLKLP